MTLEYRNQPFKTIYLVYEVTATLFVKLPYWCVIAIPKKWRPVQSRSYGRTILIQLLSHLVALLDKTGPLSKEPSYKGLEGTNGIWIDPVPDNLIAGQLKLWSTTSSVQSIRIPGYFYGVRLDKENRILPSQKVVLSLHGGGYTQETAHPSGITSNIARALIEKTSSAVATVFAIEYRLSTTHSLKPSNPFPAALLDALAGYCFLVGTLGISPSDIIIEGDSAGGNLALALTRYLVEQKDYPDMPQPPGGLLLLSPWCDIGLSHNTPPSRFTLQKDYDPPPHGADYAKRAFVGPHGMHAADTNPYISPGSRDPSMQISFKGFPKTFICAGETENLYPQIQLLRQRLLTDLGDGNVEYWEGRDEPHDFLIFPSLTPNLNSTWQQISSWIHSL